MTGMNYCTLFTYPLKESVKWNFNTVIKRVRGILSTLVRETRLEMWWFGPCFLQFSSCRPIPLSYPMVKVETHARGIKRSKSLRELWRFVHIIILSGLGLGHLEQGWGPTLRSKQSSGKVLYLHTGSLGPAGPQYFRPQIYSKIGTQKLENCLKNNEF